MKQDQKYIEHEAWYNPKLVSRQKHGRLLISGQVIKMIYDNGEEAFSIGTAEVKKISIASGYVSFITALGFLKAKAGYTVTLFDTAKASSPLAIVDFFSNTKQLATGSLKGKELAEELKGHGFKVSYTRSPVNLRQLGLVILVAGLLLIWLFLRASKT